ncbi:hypothetical protein DXG01_004515 [Tephrocybe rancida]|nr:hypothetical protein DXG01_004515 [Tephrocybe rancida]
MKLVDEQKKKAKKGGKVALKADKENKDPGKKATRRPAAVSWTTPDNRDITFTLIGIIEDSPVMLIAFGFDKLFFGANKAIDRRTHEPPATTNITCSIAALNIALEHVLPSLRQLLAPHRSPTVLLHARSTKRGYDAARAGVVGYRIQQRHLFLCVSQARSQLKDGTGKGCKGGEGMELTAYSERGDVLAVAERGVRGVRASRGLGERGGTGRRELEVRWGRWGHACALVASWSRGGGG